MALTVAEAERVARAGADALRAGNPAEAKRHFEALAQSGRANLQIWLLLAHCSALAGDLPGAERAADEVLRADGRNIRAMILKGDARRAAGDDRAATSFYRTAAGIAAQLGEIPTELAAELDRAGRAAREISLGFRRRLEDHLGAVGLDVGHRSRRFQESIDILLEEKQVYFQQPTAYYFPGLPQVQFYEPSDFAWAAGIEQATEAIRAELEAALADPDSPFSPYLQAQANRPSDDAHGLLDNPDWSSLHLWENGTPVAARAGRFARTLKALDQAPLCRITVRAPNVMFSLLRPRARIVPHHGMLNARLICHLPLIVPPGCGFRVGNEVRQWEPGKLLIFDDTIEHEAWNDSDRDRIVLIFDVWRPELGEDERRAVTEIFRAIDAV